MNIPGLIIEMILTKDLQSLVCFLDGQIYRGRDMTAELKATAARLYPSRFLNTGIPSLYLPQGLANLA